MSKNPPLYVLGTINNLPTREAAFARLERNGIYVIQPLNKDQGFALVRCSEKPLYEGQAPFRWYVYEVIDTRDKE
jgi:hypothetical protein